MRALIALRTVVRFPECAFAMALMTAMAAGPAGAQCQYEVAIIDAPPCPFAGPVEYANGMNSFGHVVGWHFDCDANWKVAFLWTPQDGYEALHRLPGFDGALAEDVNDSGQIVGFLEQTRRSAALWQDGEIIELGMPPEGNWSEAIAINNAGEIVGDWGNDIYGPMHGFIWRDGVMTDLGPILGTSNSGASDIGESGQIVGWMGESVLFDCEAYLLDDGVVIGLGPVPGGYTAEACAVNELDQVVGWGRVPEDGYPFGVGRAFLWTDGQMVALGTLPGHPHSAARDINNAGQIVGGAAGAEGFESSHGFIWQHGVMTALDDLIDPDLDIHISAANAINEQGQIAAHGWHPEDLAAFLLTPIPGSPADLDGDCRTDEYDLAILLDSWGDHDSPADFNEDGVVNVPDLLFLLAHWGTTR
jgi:probable HAF family extracellular repeat protein